MQWIAEYLCHLPAYSRVVRVTDERILLELGQQPLREAVIANVEDVYGDLYSYIRDKVDIGGNSRLEMNAFEVLLGRVEPSAGGVPAVERPVA